MVGTYNTAGCQFAYRNSTTTNNAQAYYTAVSGGWVQPTNVTISANNQYSTCCLPAGISVQAINNMYLSVTYVLQNVDTSCQTTYDLQTPGVKQNNAFYLAGSNVDGGVLSV